MRGSEVLSAILLSLLLLLLLFIFVRFFVLKKNNIQLIEVEEPQKSESVVDYHMVLFAYGNNAINSHVFATWTKSVDKELEEQVDISWDPVKKSVKMIGSEVVGENKSLKETLPDFYKSSLRKYWLMKTDQTMYESARQKQKSLKYYQLIDKSSRPNAVNCIHAVSDVGSDKLSTGALAGVNAGKAIYDHFTTTGKGCPCTDYWILSKLSIKKQ